MAQNGQGMDPAVLDDIINRLLEFRQARSVRQSVRLSEVISVDFAFVSREIFLQQPNLLELEGPIKICGRGQSKFMGKNEGFVYKRYNQLFPNDSLYPTRCEVSVRVSLAGLASFEDLGLVFSWHILVGIISLEGLYQVMKLKEQLFEAKKEIQRLLERSDGVSSNSPASLFSMEAMDPPPFLGKFGMEGFGNIFYVPKNNYNHSMDWVNLI
ncbi:Serine/threonine-protein phosphatase PP1 isozyme 2 [Camellia lanceoleosa]|uniref:Serine/threonine-protein phosphatase PP1 isozyme 2 n=1 Tax=Camellia lanceoleosa TaxID=1840588 RepID=A0ACC0HBZ7_9ERIC|nr:Serine/threonine-protein phosphatase PP1 isozyme 2 [Camellia lanceoleosa]